MNEQFEIKQEDDMEKKICCNMCKREIGQEDYLDVEKKWGYFSGKDQKIYRFRICEACFDSLIGNFRIPAEGREQTELL